MANYLKGIILLLSLNLAVFAEQPTTCRVSTTWLKNRIDKLGTDSASPEIQELVVDVKEDIGMKDFCVEVRKMKSFNALRVLAVGRHHLFVDENLLKDLDEEGQCFLIGRELLRLRDGHCFKEMIIPVVIFMASIPLSFFLLKSVDKIFPSSNSLQRTAIEVIAAELFIFGAGFCSLAPIKRYYEKKADKAAAKELEGADFFSRYYYELYVEDQESDDNLLKTLYPQGRWANFKKYVENFVFQATIPAAERIDYLKKLIPVAQAA